jgi:hypothetical protein
VSAFCPETEMYGFSFRKFFSPMPFTFIRSSIFLKPPFFCRNSRMRCAAFAPIPGSDSSCAWVAVLRLTGVAGTDAVV